MSTVLRRVALLFVVTAAPVFSQQPNLRIYGIGFGDRINTGDGPRRPDGAELVELPVTLSEDGRHARFRLMVSVRNYGTVTERYKLRVQLDGRGRAISSTVLDVAKAAVRREPYDVDLDLAVDADSPETTDGSLSSPTPIFLLPPNPVLTHLLLLTPDGRELGRRSFNLILRSVPKPIPLRTDLKVDEPRLIYTPARRSRGEVVTNAHVEAHARVRNVGTEIWGFRGEVYFHLQMGTPETRLEDLGEPGMPTSRSLPLPAGLASGSSTTLSTRLETRVRSGLPIGDRILSVAPPLRPGIWYTLTVNTTSDADLNPSNDAVRFIFILSDGLTIRESRVERVTDRVRVITR